MTWLITALPLAFQLITLLPQISHAWNSATGNSLQKVQQVLQNHASQDLINALTEIGSSQFPALSPTLHAAAAALIHAESHTGAAAWVQAALNIAQAAGLVKFDGMGAAGSNLPLGVDGAWGPRSQAALKALQAHFGLPVTGMFADLELSALNAILAK